MRDSVAPREMRIVYTLRGITYVPHYNQESYVGPGYTTDRSRCYTSAQLLAAGARPEMRLLFIRANTI